MRPLGRIVVKDARDGAYPMRAVAQLLELPPVRKYWTPGPVLNQGETSECVAYTWEGWLNASPVRTRHGPTPDVIYARAQAIDGIPGPHDGSTVRAGAEVMRADGRVGSYVWAQRIADVRDFLMQRGPVAIGINWYESFDDPRINTTDMKEARLEIAGGVRGGHAMLLTGYSPVRGYRMRNSWGKGWGINGSAWFTERDLDRLLFSEDGEAAGCVEIAVGK